MKKYQTPTAEWNFYSDLDVIRTSSLVFAINAYDDPENASGVDFEQLF